jgi:hypothetical protein
MLRHRGTVGNSRTAGFRARKTGGQVPTHCFEMVRKRQCSVLTGRACCSRFVRCPDAALGKHGTGLAVTHGCGNARVAREGQNLPEPHGATAASYSPPRPSTTSRTPNSGSDWAHIASTKAEQTLRDRRQAQHTWLSWLSNRRIAAWTTESSPRAQASYLRGMTTYPAIKKMRCYQVEIADNLLTICCDFAVSIAVNLL